MTANIDTVELAYRNTASTEPIVSDPIVRNATNITAVRNATNSSNATYTTGGGRRGRRDSFAAVVMTTFAKVKFFDDISKLLNLTKATSSLTTAIKTVHLRGVFVRTR